MQYKINLNTFDKVKKFSSEITNITSDAMIRTEDRKYAIDARSIMAIFSLDLSRNLILEIAGDENLFIDRLNELDILLCEVNQ